MGKGFSYYLTPEQIEEYKKWPVGRRRFFPKKAWGI